jgi:hypothetical protein
MACLPRLQTNVEYIDLFKCNIFLQFICANSAKSGFYVSTDACHAFNAGSKANLGKYVAASVYALLPQAIMANLWQYVAA